MAVESLMKHQCEGVEFLLTQGSGLLAFEQGLGKTLVAIESFRRVLTAGHAERLLVLCPNSLKRNWAAELGKFAPELEFTIVEGTPKRRRQAFAELDTPVAITSYETARAEVTAVLALLSRARTVLVLDESHATKNRSSLTSTAAYHFAPKCTHRWLLSGTPVTNSPADLHTQIGILVQGRHPLGSAEEFTYDIEHGSPTDRNRAIAKTLPFVLRRTKEQCLSLPPKLIADRLVELPAWQRRLYNEMRDGMVTQIRSMTGDEYRAFASTALVRLTRLMQIASNPSLVGPECPQTPGKWLELDDLVYEIVADPDHKVIIWSSYVRNIECLLKRYTTLGAVGLYGGTAPAFRQELAVRFQQDPSTRVLVANPAAAGTGFTLTAASYTIYESLSWRYDFYAQSQDRNHRIGQTVPVTYTRLIAADTIEEAVLRALERKGGLARDMLDNVDASGRLSELSQDEMCHLLMHNRMPEDDD